MNKNSNFIAVHIRTDTDKVRDRYLLPFERTKMKRIYSTASITVELLTSLSGYGRILLICSVVFHFLFILLFFLHGRDN